MDVIVDWLLDGVLWEIYTGCLKIIAGALDFKTLTQMASMTPSQFMDGKMWAFVTEISSSFMSVIGWSLLSLFLLLSIADVLKKQDVRGSDGMFMIGMVFLKILIAKVLMDNASTIINAVFEIVGALANSVNATTLGKGGAAFSDKTLESLVNNLDKKGIGNSKVVILAMMVTPMPLVFSMILSVLAKVIIYLRFMEIMVFSSVAPLAIATWPSEEWGSIFRNWLKRLVAVGFHAVLIMFVLSLYGPMVEWALTKGFSGGYIKGWFAPILVMFQICGYQLVLVLGLFQTGGWARSLLNAQ